MLPSPFSDLSTAIRLFFSASRAHLYAFDLLIDNVLPIPRPVFPKVSSFNASFRFSSLYALVLGFGVYLHPQSLQYIR